MVISELRDLLVGFWTTDLIAAQPVKLLRGSNKGPHSLYGITFMSFQEFGSLGLGQVQLVDLVVHQH